MKSFSIKVPTHCAHIRASKEEKEIGDRGKGIRPKQNVIPNGCPFGFRMAFETKLGKFRIQWACTEHKGHVISEVAFNTCY